jgi:hypothetical protein
MYVVVSKLRFYRKLMIPHERLDPDISVLSMAMEMHCQPRANDARPVTETYTLAKKASLDAEQNNIASLGILQALLLIALYEVDMLYTQPLTSRDWTLCKAWVCNGYPY